MDILMYIGLYFVKKRGPSVGGWSETETTPKKDVCSQMWKKRARTKIVGIKRSKKREKNRKRITHYGYALTVHDLC